MMNRWVSPAWLGQARCEMLLGDADDVQGDELQGQRDEVLLEAARGTVSTAAARVSKGMTRERVRAGLARNWMIALVMTPKRAFRADEEVHQVVAGAALDQLAAQGEDVAGRRHHLQPADVVADDAVFDGPAAARVRGDHAADHGALLAGVGREVEAGLVHGLLELEQGDARLGVGHLVRGDRWPDGLHPLQREDQAAGAGNTAAAQPRGASARGHGQAVLIGQPQDGGDLGGRPRPDHERRAAPDDP